MFPRKLHKQFVKKPVLDVENDWESKQDFMPLSSNSDSPVFWKLSISSASRFIKTIDVIFEELNLCGRLSVRPFIHPIQTCL